VDSGATHHITSNAHSLTTTQDYHGPETVSMGDGNTIPISHTGNTNLCASNYQFTLLNTLCAPSIKWNLVSDSQFCCGNQTSIEFFPFHYLVKDLTTGVPSVRGQSKSGLYEWPLGSTSTHPQCNFSTPLHLWYRRFGHPNSRVINKLFL